MTKKPLLLTAASVLCLSAILTIAAGMGWQRGRAATETSVHLPDPHAPYFVNCTIEGERLAFIGGGQYRSMPNGVLRTMATHRSGGFNDIVIKASSESRTDEYVELLIRTDRPSRENNSYEGYVAYRAADFWWQGNCHIRITGFTGLAGHMEGNAVCDPLADIGHKTADTKSLSDLEFNVKMMGQIDARE